MQNGTPNNHSYRARIVDEDGPKIGFALQKSGNYKFNGDREGKYSCSELKVVSNQMTTALRGEMVVARKSAANKAYVNYEFDTSVEADDGWEWETGSDTISKIVYLTNPDGGDSDAVRFKVEFARNSCFIIDACDYKIP